jgi:hypothetical protein
MSHKKKGNPCILRAGNNFKFALTHNKLHEIGANVFIYFANQRILFL